MTHVELPVSWFSETASINKRLGSEMYASVDLVASLSMFSQRRRANMAGSMPDSAQPPTPSATARMFSCKVAASSPPLFFF